MRLPGANNVDFALVVKIFKPKRHLAGKGSLIYSSILYNTLQLSATLSVLKTDQVIMEHDADTAICTELSELEALYSYVQQVKRTPACF